MKLSGIGERAIIESLFRSGHVHGGSDDCVVIRENNTNFLVSTDSVSTRTNIPKGASASQIGKFLASINLSDVAAMAGIPIGMVASFNVPESFDSVDLERIVESCDTRLNEFGAQYLGGDTKESRDMVISGTIIGKQNDSLLRRRSDIRKGQVVCVTGDMGRAASGYIFYSSDYRKSFGIDLLLDISPKVREAQVISRNGGKFMTDLSDGISSSIFSTKKEFGIGFRLVQDEIPLDSNVKKAIQLSGASDLDIALNYGGDYELMFTIENENYAAFRKSMEKEGIKVSYIGDTWEGDNMIFDGQRWNMLQPGGYEHFRGKRGIGTL